MSRMAGNIRKSEQALTEDSTIRTKASTREHSTSNSPTSFRFPPEILAKLEDLREAEKKRKGKIPSIAEIIEAESK